jgi:hypothetical protein
MKMSSMVGVCSAMALCLAVGTAQAGPNSGASNKNQAKSQKKVVKPARTIGSAKPKLNLPAKVGGIRRNADGTYTRTTPAYDYNGGMGGKDAVELCFDALQCDDTGAPIGGTECGLPGDGYRYYWGTTAALPFAAEDMTLDAKFNNAQATGASFLYWWTDNGTGNYWYIAVFTMEGFDQNCGGDYTNGETVYDGVVFSFLPLTTGFWYTPALGLDAYGLFFQMPSDSDGGYIFILADAFDGEQFTLAANPAHMGMYGTSEDGGLPDRPGTNTGVAYLDGWNSAPNGDLNDDCADLTFGLCPDPLANAMSFFAEAGGGNECYADCNEDTVLDLFDFLCFVNAFNANDPYANCNGDGALDLFDFLCYVNAFNTGCGG